MEPQKFPSDHDFFDPTYVREWAQSTEIKNPDRPAFFEAFALAIGQIAQVLGRGAVVLELGSGPGRLASHVLAQAPVERYYLLDYSPAMHSLAREQIGDNARAVFIRADFTEPSWTTSVPDAVDVVASMQAVHELRDSSRTPALYRQVIELFGDSGWVLVCDRLRPEDDDRPVFMTIAEHRSALEEAGLTDTSVLRQSETMALLTGRVERSK